MKTPSSPSPVTVEKVPIAQTVAQGGLLGGEQLTNQSKLVKKDAVSATTVQEKETLGKPGDVAANTVPGQMELMRSEMQAMNDRWARLHEQLQTLPDDDWDNAPFVYIEWLKHGSNIGELVNRFLAWRLPESVCSDQCVTERGYPHRSGTNLLTADEARQMVEYLLTPSVPNVTEKQPTDQVSPKDNPSASSSIVEQEKWEVDDQHSLPLNIIRAPDGQKFVIGGALSDGELIVQKINASIERAVKQQR